MNDLLEREGRRIAACDDLPVWDPGVRFPRWSGLLAVVALVIGAVAVAVGNGRGPARPRPVERPSYPVEVFAGTTWYPAGHSTGWHRHPGPHRVRVVAGVLTVYGPECVPASYGPGQEYVGGDAAHLARNDSDTDLEMTVTYLLDPSLPLPALRIDEPAPEGCGER